MTLSEIGRQINIKKSMLCVGLDTDWNKIPDCIRSKFGSSDKEKANAVLEFNKAIIDATSGHCIAFKPNLAFYELLGKYGLDALYSTVDYIRANVPDMFIIADAKRGDIGNTAEMYAHPFFETFDFDAVTLSPYMGMDTVAPFLKYKGKYAIVVALSSNGTAADFQYAIQDGKPLYQSVMEKSMEISSPENMMFVVGATKAEKLAGIRKFCPDNFFLVPGVGAQGGSAEEVMFHGANQNGGLFINSSRAVIYASGGKDFAERAAEAAKNTAPIAAKPEEK